MRVFIFVLGFFVFASGRLAMAAEAVKGAEPNTSYNVTNKETVAGADKDTEGRAADCENCNKNVFARKRTDQDPVKTYSDVIKDKESSADDSKSNK